MFNFEKSETVDKAFFPNSVTAMKYHMGSTKTFFLISSQAQLFLFQDGDKVLEPDWSRL